MSAITKLSILSLCAAAICAVAGWPGALKFVGLALLLAVCRAAWLFCVAEDVADVYERRQP